MHRSNPLVSRGGAAVAALAGLITVLTLAGASPAVAQWQNGPDSPFLFTRFDGEYSLETGLVYFLGGRLGDGSTSGEVWSFDPVTGNYADTGTAMVEPISNYEIARLVDGSGDEVLVTFGGRPAAGGVVNTVQGYYPGANSSTVFASDPYPVTTAPGGVAVVNNKAYVFGGFDAAVVIPDTYIFDILAASGSRWTEGPPLNLARSYIATAVVDGFVYALGGDTWDGTALYASTIAERLDTSNPVAWDDASVADMPVACDENRAFGFDAAAPYGSFAGKIVTAGCGQWSSEIAESMIYDTATDTWDQAFPDLNNARRNHAGVMVPAGYGPNGQPGIWVFGGRQGSDSNILATPEFYNLVILLDGFETGDTSHWSLAVP
jgi:hypothetical protein